MTGAKGKRIELIEDSSFKGLVEEIDEKGITILWDINAPDGGSKWVRYSNTEESLKRIKVVE
ncbi:hypothetical protein P4V47_16625 [Brevibacillus laterosporus]|uniref:hypothetical protein n=1 Tax=Brevibacillus laterosporus TaxID=1465 RepID=UPI002E2497B6|nr:hypothetical protein [Brevibacillus laterosporus]